MEKDLLACGGCGHSATPQSGARNENGGSCMPVCQGHEGCGPDSWGLTNYPLAMVYAPCQMFGSLYDTDTALRRGTLFSELDLPLGCSEGKAGDGSCCHIRRNG